MRDEKLLDLIANLSFYQDAAKVVDLHLSSVLSDTLVMDRTSTRRTKPSPSTKSCTVHRCEVRRATRSVRFDTVDSSRRKHSHSSFRGWLRFDLDDERRAEKVLRTLFPQSRPRRRRRTTLLQTASKTTLERLLAFDIIVSSQEIILWRKQDKDKDKAKDSAKRYSHYEAPTSSIKSEESVNGVNAGESSPAHGPLSSENNSDSPSDWSRRRQILFNHIQRSTDAFQRCFLFLFCASLFPPDFYS